MSFRVTFKAALFFPNSVGLFSNGLIVVVHWCFSSFNSELRVFAAGKSAAMPLAASAGALRMGRRQLSAVLEAGDGRLYTRKSPILCRTGLFGQASTAKVGARPSS